MKNEIKEILKLFRVEFYISEERSLEKDWSRSKGLLKFSKKNSALGEPLG